MTHIKIFEHKIELLVWVKPGASHNQVLKPTERGLALSVCATAQDGKANEAVIKLLSNFFNIPQSSISIFKGHLGRQKRVSLPNREEVLTVLKTILELPEKK